MPSKAQHDEMCLALAATALYDGEAEIPAHLQRPGFFEDCSAALRNGGVLVVNVFNGRAGSPARRQIERLLGSPASAGTQPLPAQWKTGGSATFEHIGGH